MRRRGWLSLLAGVLVLLFPLTGGLALFSGAMANGLGTSAAVAAAQDCPEESGTLEDGADSAPAEPACASAAAGEVGQDPGPTEDPAAAPGGNDEEEASRDGEAAPSPTAEVLPAEDPSAGPPAEDPGVSAPADDPGVSDPVDDPGVSVPVDDPGVSVPVDDPGVTAPADDPVATTAEDDSRVGAWEEGPNLLPQPLVLEVVLSQNATSGPVGSTAEVVATVTDDGEPSAGEAVAFTATMDGAPYVTLEEVTDASGSVTFEYSRDLTGVDLIVVEVAPDVLATTTFTWVEAPPPGEGLEISIAPLDATGPVGTTVGFVATVTEDGEPVAGEFVDFFAFMDGASNQHQLGETGLDGTVTFLHSRDVTGIDSIEVWLAEVEIDASTTFTWMEAPPPVVEISVAPQDASGPVGTTVEFVVTATYDGGPSAGEFVYFSATMEGESAVFSDGVTGADGTVTFEHTRDVTGVDTIFVEVYPGIASAETTFTWEDVPPPGEGLEISIAPVDSSGPVGSTLEFVATVTDDGEPAAGELVDFFAVMEGSDDYVSMEGVTQEDGTVSFEHTREVTGVDNILVVLWELEIDATTTFTWVEAPPVVEISIAPQDASGQVWVEVAFLATVTVDGEPSEGEMLFFSSSMDGAPPVTYPGVMTGEDGTVTFFHVRDVTGVDTVEVRIGDSEISASTTFTWLPPPVVELEPLDASGPVGETVDFVATVTIDGVPTPGVWVDFAAWMEGVGDVGWVAQTGEDGTVTFPHSRDVAGVDLIEVWVGGDGEGESSYAWTTFTWEPLAPVDVQITLEPQNSSAQEGATVEFTATVTGDGEPLAGEVVYFYAVMGDSSDVVFLEGVTDQDGVATFEHTRDVRGIETIEVTTYAYESSTSDSTTFTWRAPLMVTLSAGTGSAEVGTLLVVTATVSSDDPASEGAQPTDFGPAWEEGVSVRFLAQMPGQPDVDVLLTTDADGVATYTHTRTVPGSETLRVEATILDETASADGTFVWEAVPPVVQLGIEPLDGTGVIGETVEFAATMTGDDEPLEGELVNFTASLVGTDDSVSLQALTDADGVARFEHSRDVTGVDEIWVTAYSFEQEVGAETTFTWVEPPPVIELSQSSGTGEVGTPLVLTATLTSGGEGLSGVGVRFLSQMTGQPDVDVTVPTDVDGVASYTYTRLVPGTDNLMVGATVGEDTVFAFGSFVWEPVPPPAVVAIAVEPVDSSGPVGESVDFVATVTTDGEPWAGQAVTFTAAMAGSPTVDLMQNTDEDGRALFAHVRESTGVDAITVTTLDGEEEISAATAYSWQLPPPPVLALTQSATSGEVGTSLVWTASVTAGGAPLAGADVRFLGQLPGAPDVDVTLTTNSSGVASHTHTRTVAGTESLQVTTTVGEQPLVATGSFVWVPAEPPVTPPPTDPPTDPPTGPPTTPPPPTAPPTSTTPPTGTTPPTATAPPTVTPPVVAPSPTTQPTQLTATIPFLPETTSPTDSADEETGTDDSDTAGPTGSADGGTTTPPPVPSPAPSAGVTLTDVVLGRQSAIPGGDLEVSGSGCEPGSTVVITLDGQTLATTTADTTGAFSVRAAVSNAPLGQYAVDVLCGDARSEAVVDLVSTVESSTAVASAASAAAVLAFFVLLGSSVYRGSLGSVG